jgi:hypothetical protein
MRLELSDFSQSGKTTLFNALTRWAPSQLAFPQEGLKYTLLVVDVPDPRVDSSLPCLNQKKPSMLKSLTVSIAGLDGSADKGGIYRDTAQHLPRWTDFIHGGEMLRRIMLFIRLMSVRPVRDVQVMDGEFILMT